MFSNPAWTVDVTRVLTRRELATVLVGARAQAERSLNAQRNLIIVRLACCCGLRVSEIESLRIDDVNVDGARPHIRLRRETTKGKKARCVPLWWDAGTLTDLAEWQAERIATGRPRWRSVRVQRAVAPARSADPAGRDSAAVPIGVQGAWAGPAADADDPPRPAHVHFACARRRANVGRSASGGWALERGDHERVSACGGG